MSNDQPGPDHAAPSTPWWARVRDAVRYVLAMEPAAVHGIFRAVLILLAATGLRLSDTVEPQGLAIIGAFYALVEVVTTVHTRMKSTPVAAVVERADPGTGRVVAGPASELPTGQDVRAIGSLGNRVFPPA